MQIELVENHVDHDFYYINFINLGTPASCFAGSQTSYSTNMVSTNAWALPWDGLDAYALYICGFCGAPEATLFVEEIATPMSFVGIDACAVVFFAALVPAYHYTMTALSIPRWC